MFAALLLLANPAQARDLVWTGIDYGDVHMVGSLDFNDPDEIFPDYLIKWNGLFIGEMMPLLEKRLGVHAKASTSHLGPIHRATDPDSHIVRDDSISPDESYLSPADVAKRVTTYDLTAKEGLGLTFIADQLNKPTESGCYWVTFYDIASRDVLSTSRRCAPARGFGFRNYWFRTVKTLVSDLRKKDLPRQK